jgi:dolichyl-phosphate-mannose-protein mannosyltransferase
MDSAYGDRLIQDVHDYWTVKILTDENTPNRDNNITWQALNQRFRLQHIRGCLLISHNVFYTPPEGENHQEVTCMASAGTHISPWIVESSYHQQCEYISCVHDSQGTYFFFSLTVEDLPLATFEKISMYDMFKEVHKLMYQYAVIMYDRLQSSAPAELPVQKVSRGETPSKWFFRRASLRIWGELKGYTTHLVINPTVQSLVVLLMLNYVGLLCLNSFLTKRQIKLPSCLSWLHADSMFNEFYSRSIMLFYTATVIHVAGLNFLPVHMISMSDILGSIYYGAGLAAVMIESFTLRLSSLMRRIVIYGFIFGCIARFSGLSLLTYGRERFYREQCEKSRIDMDCVHFPRQQPVDTLDGSTRTSSPTNTVFVGLAGQVQAFSYNYGQEAEADKHIAVLKQQSFAKEAQNATGVYRFHRVSPTPAISPEEAVQWAQQVHSGAVQRAKAAKEKAAIEKEKKKSKKKNKNKPAQEVLVDGGPIMDQI